VPELGDDEPPEQPANATATSATHPILPTMQRIIGRTPDDVNTNAVVEQRV